MSRKYPESEKTRLLEKLELYLWSTIKIDFNLRGFAGLELARNLRSKFGYLKSEAEIPVYGPTGTNWVSDVITGITKSIKTDKKTKANIKFVRIADPEKSVIQLLQVSEADIRKPEKLPAKTKFVIIRGSVKSELPLETINLGYDTYTVLNADEFYQIDSFEVSEPEISLQIDDFETIRERIAK